MDYSFKVKATLAIDSDSFFGPGVYTILKIVDKTSSLQSACREMGMAYSKGWRILKHAEQSFGKALLQTKSGGSHGGYSYLTPFAKKTCLEYEKFCEEIDIAAQIAFEKLKESLKNETD